MNIAGVDLFCGAGGLSHGLKQAGVDIRAGIDVDAHCHFPFEENNEAEFIQRDVATITKEDLDRLFVGADVRLLAGCAPCQPFSSYSQGNRAKAGDERWQLLDSFVSLVEQALPELVTMENVTGLRNHPIFARFVSRLQAQGYKVNVSVLKGPEVGLPQTRKRLVLLASRFGWPIFTEASSVTDVLPTVRQVIGSLDPVEAGSRASSDMLHRASSLSPLYLRRLKASKPGGTWRDWPKELQAVCHSKMDRPSYVSVYGRMEWDKPSPTITTQFYTIGHGRFGHPEQDRAITPREAAILQGFPPKYQFVREEKDFAFTKLGRMIGNAVPVPFGRLIGESLKAHAGISA